MKILVADDEKVSRTVIQTLLVKWGHEVVVVENGLTALDIMKSPDAPKITILDWMMPGMDGPEICHKIRELGNSALYIMILTAKGEKQDIIAGLEAGADDYITKPFNNDELRARLNVGLRIVQLQDSLSARIKELENALSHVKQLRGLLPICSYCKKIRDDQNYWQQVEAYLIEHTDASFSHSICPECYEKFVKKEFSE